MNIVSITQKLGKPKYKQIVISIEKAISEGTLKKGDVLPSINSIRDNHGVSRDTVLSAFNELKARGIVKSIVGKGYYVTSENVNVVQKIFLLFDEFNSFKEDLYNAFISNLDDNVKIDIYFHHFNFEVFSKTISDNIGDYNYYIIMPANFTNTNEVLELLPKERVYILDQTHEDLSHYSAIYQNFEADIFNSLSKGIDLIIKYKKLILLFSEDKQPSGMLNGFEAFCNKHDINSAVICSLEMEELKHGDVYLIPDDKNLIRILKKIKVANLKLAKDIGVISYNDTLLKELVEGGITTISTDFNNMGERLAQMIRNNEFAQVENPNNLIIRNSL